MKLGIMQPYFFPYIGYWQLMNAVDKYVIYDDVNYIKGGWINRNRILLNGQAHYYNLPCVNLSVNKLINESEANLDVREIEKQLRKLKESYKNAPNYKDVFPIIENIMCSNISNLAEYLTNQIQVICGALGIKTELIISSSLQKDNSLKGQEKVLAICRELAATEYYNAIGGKTLYSTEAFQTNGIKLSFLRTNEIIYEQFKQEFVPNLSIIDVMMFNSRETIQKMLMDYTLE